MATRRTVFIAALCTLASPVAAFADGAAESQNTNTAPAPAPAPAAQIDCDAVCAQRAQAAAEQRAVRRRAAARAAAARSARVAAAPDASATMHIASRITRQVGPGCEYVAATEGTYRSADMKGVDATAPIHDVDVRGDASLTCYGEVVRRRTQRFIFPTTTRDELAELLNARLRTPVPGTPCSWSSTYDFAGGDLHATAVVATNCNAERRQLSLRDYGSSGRTEVGVIRGFERPAARGGGPAIPRDPDSFDARTGAH